MPCARWIILVLAAPGLLAASAASARDEMITWSYEHPCDVEGFEIRYGPSPSSLDDVIPAEEVGRPRQVGGQFSYVLEGLPEAGETHVCVVAVRGDERSACSNTLVLSAATAKPILAGNTPAPEAELCEDFSGGTRSSDWVDTGAGASLVQESGLFRVEMLDRHYPMVRSEALVLSTPGDDVHSHFLGWDGAGVAAADWTAYEYSGQMMVKKNDGGVGVTLYSSYTDEDDYYRLGRHPKAANFVLERPGRFGLNCNPQVDPVHVAAGQWYNFRILAENGPDASRFTAKVWHAASREPQRPQLDCTDIDPARQLSGAVGVWASGNGTKAWDSLRVSAQLQTDVLGPPGKPEVAE